MDPRALDHSLVSLFFWAVGGGCVTGGRIYAVTSEPVVAADVMVGEDFSDMQHLVTHKKWEKGKRK